MTLIELIFNAAVATPGQFQKASVIGDKHGKDN